MNLTEKAEEVRTTAKSCCKQSVKPHFPNFGRSTENVGKCRKKPAPFSCFSRHIPKPLAEKVCSKSFYLARVLSIRRPFSAYSENYFGFIGASVLSQQEKMPVTMRPEKMACYPHADGLRAVGSFLRIKIILKKIPDNL